MTKTLKNFLKEHSACSDGYLFAKDLTLQEFLKTCQRGDWILWLFKKSNPNSLKELTLTKGHCAATAIHLMKDDASKKAVQAAIDFGEGKIGRKELDASASAAYTAASAAAAAASAAAAAYAAASAAAAYAAAAAAAYNASAAAASAAAAAAYTAASAAAAAAYPAYAAAAAASSAASAAAAYAASASAYTAYAAYASASAEEANKKETADICRKYLPAEIWNIK